MPRGRPRGVRPPWGVDDRESVRQLGLEDTRSETQRLGFHDTSKLSSKGLGRVVEPQPPSYPRVDKRIQVVTDRDFAGAVHARRNLVWYDTEHGNTRCDKVHGSKMPSMSARANAAAALSTPPKPFWTDRPGTKPPRRDPPASGRRAIGGGPPNELGAKDTKSGYSGFRPRNDVEQRDPHRYNQPTGILERAAMTSVQRGVYGYRGFIPRDIRDKGLALPIGHVPMEARQQRFMHTTECSTPPPPLGPNITNAEARTIEMQNPSGHRLNGPLIDQQAVPPAHARGYTGFVARAAKGQVNRANAGVSQINNSHYQAPLNFERSMRRPKMVRHGENDHGANRTQLGMSPS